MDLARHIELVQFKASSIIAKQDEVQERPLFLMLGEVIMQRQIKD
jgi:hypothetical protein